MNKTFPSKTSTIEEKVMNKIHTNELHMRSRYYYLYISALSVSAIILLIIASTYFVSIATLWLRIRAAEGPAYGARQNLTVLTDTFPWWALLLGLISLAGMIYFVNKAGQMYKLRLLYLIPLVVALIAVIGFMFSYSALPRMFNHHRSNISCTTNDVACNSYGRDYMRHR